MFQRTLRQITRKMDRNTVAIWMAAPLQYLWITVKVVALKKSLLVKHKILRVFFNRMTIDDKHYLLNRDKWTEPIRVQLSQKEKAFSEFFFGFLKSILIFKHLQTKDDPHSWCISGNTGSEKYVEINIWKAVFQRTLRHRTRQMGRNIVPI